MERYFEKEGEGLEASPVVGDGDRVRRARWGVGWGAGWGPHRPPWFCEKVALRERMRILGILRKPRTRLAVSDGIVEARIKESGIGTNIAFDAQGSLAVEANHHGELIIHRFDAIRELARLQESAGQTNTDLPQSNAEMDRVRTGLASSGDGPYTPSLVIRTRRCLTDAVWCPSDQDVVMCSSKSDDEAHLYDLRYCTDAPTETLRQRKGRLDGFGGGKRPGIASVAFADSGGQIVLGASHGGEMYCWDRRAKVKLQAIYAAPSSSGDLRCVVVHPECHTAITGSHYGNLLLWDLRKEASAVSQRKSAFGIASLHPQKRGLLSSLNVVSLFKRIPELVAQTSIQSSAIVCTKFDPRDPRRLAIHLESGWSAVLNLQSSEVTHLHCPSTLPYQNSDAVNNPDAYRPMSSHIRIPLDRRGSWMASGDTFCIPGRPNNSSHDGQESVPLHALDFSTSLRSTCRVDTTASWVKNWAASTLSASHAIHASRCISSIDWDGIRRSQIISVACHPMTDELLCTADDGTLSFCGFPAH